MSRAVLEKAVDMVQYFSMPVNVIGGEPTLHPFFSEFYGFILKESLSYTEHVNMTTNGSFIYSPARTQSVIDAAMVGYKTNKGRVAITVSTDRYHQPYWKSANHFEMIKAAFAKGGLIEEEGHFECLSLSAANTRISLLGRAREKGLYARVPECHMTWLDKDLERYSSSPSGSDLLDAYGDCLTVWPDGSIDPCGHKIATIGNIIDMDFNEIGERLGEFVRVVHNLSPDCLTCKKTMAGVMYHKKSSALTERGSSRCAQLAFAA